jgi:TonB family protein
METMLFFLLKASAGMALFYSVYWLFLRKETFYTANRWFLLVSLLTSVFIPVFPLQYTVLVDQPETLNFRTIADTFKNIPVFTSHEVQPESFNWQRLVWLIYLAGVAVFFFRLLFQSVLLTRLLLKSEPKFTAGIRIVENKKYSLPFSFFNTVFINTEFYTQESLPEILAHEKVHIREKHWFDLLFIELLTVIFWFNPFIWFFERTIKQNHEYLADKGVLAQGHSVGRYQALLINQLMGMQVIGVTNNLNFALNTNRLKMMTKKKTSRLSGVKFAWALPAFALLLFAFAEPEFKTKPVEKPTPATNVQKAEKEQVIHGKVVRDDNKKPLAGASIVIKGTSIGTVSDFEGNFTLTNPNPEVDSNNGGLITEFVISYVGYQTESQRFGPPLGQPDKEGVLTRYDFSLKEAVIVLDMMELIKQLPPPPPPISSKSEKSSLSAKDKATPPPPPPPPAKTDAEEEVFVVVEELPKYPKGMGFLANDVMQKEKIMARENKAKGKAKIGFTVSETGKVTDVKIIEAENETAGRAAASIIEKMPDWKPGRQHGKPVPVKYILPMEFK